MSLVPAQQILISIAGLLFSLLVFSRACNRGRHGRSAWLLVPAIMAFGIMTVAYVASDYFTNRGIDDSVIFHLRYGFKGAGVSEYSLLILSSVLTLLAFGLLAWRVLRWSTINKARGHTLSGWCAAGLAVTALCTHPVSAALNKLLKTPSTNLQFTEFYRTAPEAKIEAPRNILFIYLESFEATYFNESLFPSLAPNLNRWRKLGIYHDDVGQAQSTGWTISGMIASQCGLPLVFPSHGNSLFNMEHILPGEQCLGDILANSGYRVEFIGGASLEFAGKGKFLASHGYHEIWGREELKSQLTPGTPTHSWGLYDQQLLQLLKNRMKALDAPQQPYALFGLTLDMHHPNGHTSEICLDEPYLDGKNKILNAVKCTDRLVGELLNEVLSGRSAQDVMVVLSSDHLAMKNGAIERLQSTERRNFFLILDSRKLEGEVRTEPMTTLDITPVLLSHLGLDLDVGFGRNVYQRPSVSRSTPGFDSAISAWREELERLWQFPSLDEGMRLEINPPTILIDQLEFRAPMLIEFDPNLQSRLYFTTDAFPGSKNLKDHYREIPLDSGLIWIDLCQTLDREAQYKTADLCAILGRKINGRFSLIKLTEPAVVTARQIRQVFD